MLLIFSFSRVAGMTFANLPRSLIFNRVLPLNPSYQFTYSILTRVAEAVSSMSRYRSCNLIHMHSRKCRLNSRLLLHHRLHLVVVCSSPSYSFISLQLHHFRFGCPRVISNERPLSKRTIRRQDVLYVRGSPSVSASSDPHRSVILMSTLTISSSPETVQVQASSTASIRSVSIETKPATCAESLGENEHSRRATSFEVPAFFPSCSYLFKPHAPPYFAFATNHSRARARVLL